jgi:hypothetical protein
MLLKAPMRTPRTHSLEVDYGGGGEASEANVAFQRTRIQAIQQYLKVVTKKRNWLQVTQKLWRTRNDIILGHRGLTAVATAASLTTLAEMGQPAFHLIITEWKV